MLHRWPRYGPAVTTLGVRADCGPQDAADLIAARAFAEGLRMSELASGIVVGKIRLADT